MTHLLPCSCWTHPLAKIRGSNKVSKRANIPLQSWIDSCQWSQPAFKDTDGNNKRAPVGKAAQTNLAWLQENYCNEFYPNKNRSRQNRTGISQVLISNEAAHLTCNWLELIDDWSSTAASLNCSLTCKNPVAVSAKLRWTLCNDFFQEATVIRGSSIEPISSQATTEQSPL